MVDASCLIQRIIKTITTVTIDRVPIPMINDEDHHITIPTVERVAIEILLKLMGQNFVAENIRIIGIVTRKKVI